MIYLNPEQHLNTLLTFDKSEPDALLLRGYIDSIYQEFIEYWNEDPKTRDPYFRIHYLTKLLNGNAGVETIFNELEAMTIKCFKKNFWDHRIKIKLKADAATVFRSRAKYYIILMDLDYTVSCLADLPETDESNAEIIDNPTAEDLSKV